MTRVLVAYATAHGSTREIAERIAARLTGSGLRTDCTSVTEVDDVHGYDAFVVGSAIHNQAWLPEAIRFVRHHARVLGARPTWLFSVGMPAAVAPALRGWAAREGPKVLESMRTRVHPNGERLFSGVVRRDQFPVAGRFVFWLLGGALRRLPRQRGDRRLGRGRCSPADRRPHPHRLAGARRPGPADDPGRPSPQGGAPYCRGRVVPGGARAVAA